MKLWKFVACSASVGTLVLSAGCADGTGNALTPTLPTITDTNVNADGTRLKVTAPSTLAPRASVRVSNLTPQLSVSNAAGEFADANLTYEFEVYEGSSLRASSNVSSNVWTVPANTLSENRTYSWRARAKMNDVDGSWSESAVFMTPLPRPTAADGPGPVSCDGSSGPSIIACVGRAYPEKLVGRISVARRKDNMEFIRDRIIETGICKGQDFARNFKRGTPVISHDFIVWRQPGQRDRGIDIASGYDDPRTTLKLTWQVKGPPSYGFPFYARYPRVDCSGVN
jgi:hypothetical protein